MGFSLLQTIRVDSFSEQRPHTNIFIMCHTDIYPRVWLHSLALEAPVPPYGLLIRNPSGDVESPFPASRDCPRGWRFRSSSHYSGRHSLISRLRNKLLLKLAHLIYNPYKLRRGRSCSRERGPEVSGSGILKSIAQPKELSGELMSLRHAQPI